MSAIQSTHGGAKVWLPPPLVFAAFIASGLLVHHFVYALPVPIGRTPRLISAGMIGFVGLALGASTFLLFKRTGQDPRPWQPSPELIFQGPYRWSRNPMYVSMALLQTSVGLAVDSLWVVLLWLPALIVVHYTAVLPEEKYLSERFGEAYQRYAASVRRYL